MCLGMACAETARLQCVHFNISARSWRGREEGKAEAWELGALVVLLVVVELLVSWESFASHVPDFLGGEGAVLERWGVWVELSSRSSKRFSREMGGSSVLEGFGAGAMGVLVRWCWSKTWVSCLLLRLVVPFGAILMGFALASSARSV